ncbi:unnamed protein product [Brassica napus]|uniref:RNA-dependent RNA polymerase n=1 Tax=Brassica napus TaxID=3708 RepID=A0A816S480_BRANA|nr:unnamed protein product [Brassica napus]
MISILSTLGVSDNVFEKKPKKVVDTLDSFLADHMKILHLMPLREYTKFLKDLISYGFKPSEPFLSMMLHHIRESKLVELRTKMCILIPKSRSMMGCIDETNLLEYGETKVQRALDEDLYFVSWDPELIPLKTYEPMDYTIKEPQVLDFEITIQDYLKSHKVFVNKEDDKSLRNQCLELANMFSAAADFPKTELKVKIPPHLYVKEYSDLCKNDINQTTHLNSFKHTKSSYESMDFLQHNIFYYVGWLSWRLGILHDSRII